MGSHAARKGLEHLGSRPCGVASELAEEVESPHRAIIIPENVTRYEINLHFQNRIIMGNPLRSTKV